MISVIIPFFNSENTLKRAVYSVISQDNSDWELILVNDGSSDKSEKIATSYLSDSRITYLNQENKGVGAARNLGATHANGEWLIFLDSDDELISTALNGFCEAIQMNPKIDFWQGGVRRIGKLEIVESIPREGHYLAKLVGTFSLKRSLFEQIGGYDVRLKFSENSEMFHRIDTIGSIGGFIKKITLNYHDAPDGGSKNLQNMIDSLSLILEKHKYTLSSHVKYLYHQIIGVNYIRFRKYSLARRHLFNAFLYKPLNAKTLLRFLISLMPPVAKKLYPREVKV